MGLATSTMPATDFCHWREDVTIGSGKGGEGGAGRIPETRQD